MEIFLVPLVFLQSILGMFTVTLLLQPLVVTVHLLGGLTILSILWWSLLEELRIEINMETAKILKNIAFISFAALVMQIFLGGWTSTNYAALACTDFPTCQGTFLPKLELREAFTLWRGLGIDYEHGVLDSVARTTIHFVHRVWALVTSFLITTLFIISLILGSQLVKLVSFTVFIAMIVQVGLGISNVLFGLPLPVAVAHNGGAAVLVLTMLTYLFLITKGVSRDGS